MPRPGPNPPNDDPRERALAHTLGVPELVARVLLARGIDDPERARRWLQPSLDELHDPFAFRAMAPAIERIRRALAERERILIHGDYDVDGISGTVLLLKLFALIDADATPFIPSRSDGYSFSEASIAAIERGGHRLCISVDNGTNACAPIERIQRAGCDVIVTDHHGTTEQVAGAFCVLNPRLPAAGYPDRELAGVGVAFRLATALAESFGTVTRERAEFGEFLVEALALVALGTIADVAPLRGENRILVHHGLRALAASRNPGVRALLDAAGLGDRSPTAEDIAFRIAPLLNAAGRVGHAHDAIAVLMARDSQEAAAAARVLERHNDERRRVEKELVAEAERLASACDDPILLLAMDGWHPGVLGIGAARLVDLLQRPAILIALDGERGRGSGRAPIGFDLRAALGACGDLLLAHGGHAAAVGLEVERSRIDELRARLQTAAEAARRSDPVLQLDGRIRFRELDPRQIRRLDQLGPFGVGNPRPTFVATGVRIVGSPGVDPRGQDLRLRLGQDGVVLPARLRGGARRFEELRRCSDPVRIVAAPRLSSRGEEGPVELLLHELAREEDAA